MSQKSYLVKRQIYFSNGTTYVRPGDILVYDEANAGKLTIYRGGALIGAVQQTITGIKSLLAQKQFPLIEEITQKAVEVAPPPPPPAAKVEVPPAETKAVEEVKPTVEPSLLPDPVMPNEVDFSTMTKGKIAEYAKSRGFDVNPDNYNKVDLIKIVQERTA